MIITVPTYLPMQFVTYTVAGNIAQPAHSKRKVSAECLLKPHATVTFSKSTKTMMSVSRTKKKIDCFGNV